VTQGRLSGVAAESTTAYLQIPFAAPPLGALRFRAPEPAGCFDTAPRDASVWGPVCPQLNGEVYEGVEDCLFLNVWVPDAPTDGPRPVLFFIHGGGNAQGGASEQQVPQMPSFRLYDGAALASHTGAVVVTTNYRLGPLGFLALPGGGPQAATDPIDGNEGLLDLVTALQWVQRDIAHFGGDPDRVLIFGESAGARNVCSLLGTPRSAGLYHGAIIQSSGCTQPERGLVESTGARLLTATACAATPDPVSCLRGLTPEALLRALPPMIVVSGGMSGVEYQPFPDGELMPSQPLAQIQAGSHVAVPTLVGANADEAAFDAPPLATVAQYEALVRATFVNVSARVLERYPADAYPTPRDAYITLASDVKFICPSRTVARALSDAGGAPAWRYFFTHRLENLQRRTPYAYHGLELFFVFRHLAVSGYVPSANELALSDTLASAWGTLAATGTLAAPWAPYDAATDRTTVLDGAGLSVLEGVRTENCDFWDSLVP
jgi:para-nitrobenzyl esterase